MAVKPVAVVLCFWDESGLLVIDLPLVVVVSGSYYCFCHYFRVIVVCDFAEELAFSSMNLHREEEG